MRRAALQRARCAPATLPTCDDLSVSRRLGTTRRERRPGAVRRTSSARAPSIRSPRARAPARGRLPCRSRARRDRRRVRQRPRSANATPSSAAIARLRGSTSTSSTSAPAVRAASQATRQPTVPAPITAMRSPTRGRGPRARSPRFRGWRPAPRAGAARHRATVQRGRGHDVPCLMRIQAEHMPTRPARPGRSRRSRHCCSRLHRRRKLSGLKRRAHPPCSLGGTAPVKTSVSVPRLTPE